MFSTVLNIDNNDNDNDNDDNNNNNKISIYSKILFYSILEGFLKGHVTLKTGVMMLKI